MGKWLIAFGLSLAAATPALAFRCGTHLVHEGDTRSQVIAKCGDPTEVNDYGYILRRPIIWVGGRPFAVGHGLVEVPVEVWIYNLGPSKFMRRLRFEGGLVADIDTLGYGYLESQRPDARNP